MTVIEITDTISIKINDENSDTDQCEICLHWKSVKNMNIIQGKFVCDQCKREYEG